MTRNRTALDILAVIGTQLTVLLLLVLALGLAVTRYLAGVRDRMRHIEMRVWRRAARRLAA